MGFLCWTVRLKLLAPLICLSGWARLTVLMVVMDWSVKHNIIDWCLQSEFFRAFKVRHGLHKRFLNLSNWWWQLFDPLFAWRLNFWAHLLIQREFNWIIEYIILSSLNLTLTHAKIFPLLRVLRANSRSLLCILKDLCLHFGRCQLNDLIVLLYFDRSIYFLSIWLVVLLRIFAWCVICIYFRFKV